jgi:hypothetical protein
VENGPQAIRTVGLPFSPLFCSADLALTSILACPLLLITATACPQTSSPACSQLLPLRVAIGSLLRHPLTLPCSPVFVKSTADTSVLIVNRGACVDLLTRTYVYLGILPSRVQTLNHRPPKKTGLLAVQLPRASCTRGIYNHITG